MLLKRGCCDVVDDARTVVGLVVLGRGLIRIDGRDSGTGSMRVDAAGEADVVALVFSFGRLFWRSSCILCFRRQCLLSVYWRGNCGDGHVSLRHVCTRN